MRLLGIFFPNFFDGFVCTFVPNNYSSSPVVTFRNDAFKVFIIERMVFYQHRQALFSRIHGRALWEQPSFLKLPLIQGENHNEAAKHRVFARQTATRYRKPGPPVGSGVFLKVRFFLYSVNPIPQLLEKFMPMNFR